MSSSDSASLRAPAGDSVSSSVRDPWSDLSPLRDADPLTDSADSGAAPDPERSSIPLEVLQKTGFGI